MVIELIVFGSFVGFMSGFFGIGGGTILVPLLLFIGFDMKEAVAISIMQMVFSSLYGSYLNSKKYGSIFKDGLLIGLGGSIGGMISGFIVANVSSSFLEHLFTAIVVFTLFKIAVTKTQAEDDSLPKVTHPYILILIGLVVGMIAMSIGVGGSIMITPILAAYLGYNLKHASALGLFFVIFSSISGFISFSLHDQMLFSEGLIVGIASLIGVYYGTKTKNKTHISSFKKYNVIMYSIVLIYMIYKIL